MLTRTESYKICESILIKQKNDKRQALSRILEDYRVMLDKDKETYLQLIPKYICAECGGPIFEEVHIFSRVTFGGNPIVGCLKCKTFSSAEMLYSRKDILRKS